MISCRVSVASRPSFPLFPSSSLQVFKFRSQVPHSASYHRPRKAHSSLYHQTNSLSAWLRLPIFTSPASASPPVVGPDQSLGYLGLTGPHRPLCPCADRRPRPLGSAPELTAGRTIARIPARIVVLLDRFRPPQLLQSKPYSPLGNPFVVVASRPPCLAALRFSSAPAARSPRVLGELRCPCFS